MVETEVVAVQNQRNYPAPPHSFALWLSGDLALRLRERHDASDYFARIAGNRSHLGAWFGWARTIDEATVKERVAAGLEQFAAGDGWHADLCWRGEPVGAMWLHFLDGEGGSSEVGYWLSAEHEGKGLVTRALRGLLRHFFEDRKLGRVSIGLDPRNQRSAAVVERLRLEPEAVLRRAVVDADGVLGDLAFYGLLREEWLADRDAYGGDLADVRTRRSPPRFALCVDEELDLYLAILEREDASALGDVVAANAAHLRPWMPWVDGDRPGSQRAFIENRVLPGVANGDGFECALMVGGRIVGAAGVHDVSHRVRRGSIGYWLDEGHQGRGYVTRAVEAIIERCFTVGSFDGEPFERLDIRAEVDNARSRAVPERLGFTFEGVLRRDRHNGSRYADYAIYSLLRSEWLDARGNEGTEGTMLGVTGTDTGKDRGGNADAAMLYAQSDERTDKGRPLTEEEKERREQERALDDALDDSFPASDPPSQTMPTPDDE